MQRRDDLGGTGSTGEPTVAGRRGLLKLAAVGLAGAAASQVLDPKAADAATGDYLVLGQSNSATSPTSVDGSGSTSALSVVNANGSASANVGLSASTSNGQAALQASATGSTAYGVQASAATASGSAVLAAGSGSATGVTATASSGTALAASSTAGIAISASTSGSTTALTSGSSTGIDIDASGTGRIHQKPMGTVGPPTGTSRTYTAGEQIRDSAGDLYLCVVPGAPGTWNRLAPVPAGYTGGAVVYLTSPFRLIDTRASQTDAAVHQPTITTLAANTAKTVTVTNAAYNGQIVPSGAIGIQYVVTVVGAASSNNLRIYAGDQSTPPNANSFFFLAGTNSSFGSTRLSSSGAITLYSGIALDVLIDVVSFTV